MIETGAEVDVSRKKIQSYMDERNPRCNSRSGETTDGQECRLGIG
jgi:hypothetical protein